MSTVYIDPLLAAAFNSLDALIAGEGSWSGSGRPEQEAFLGKLGALTETIASLPPGAIETIAARSAGPVNDFLASHGFAGSLREAGPQSLYAAAVLDLLVEWGNPGSATSLRVGHRSVPAVRFKKGQFRVDGKVLSLETKLGQPEVCVCESATLDEGLAVIDGLDLSAPDWDFAAAMIPMVSLDIDVDASKMIGLRNGDWTVDQAFARAKLRLDPKGAHAQAAAAMAATRGVVKTFKIAGPFTIAFVTGDGQVAIAYHVTEEHFSAPV